MNLVTAIRRCFACAALLVVCGTAAAADFVVTTTADPGNNVCDADCTLREALVAAQAAGDDRILFAIPGAGPHTIAPASNLPALAAGTLLDGYSQPGAVANSASNALNLSNAVIRIVLSGAANPSGIGLQLQGNAVLRGIAIGGWSTGVNFAGGANGAIEGCFIGLSADGQTLLANGTGINAGSGAGIVIGGPDPADRNLVSGNTSDGVFSGGDDIRNNLIGLAADGITARGNGTDGIDVRQAGAVVADNVVAHNVQAGVRINNNFATANITRNRIFANGQRGITLGTSNAVTVNDRDDPDSGPNGLQNHPELTLASRDESGVLPTREFIRVLGFLNSTPNTEFRVEYFVSATADSSGFGEGERFMDSDLVLTDGNGFAFLKLSSQQLSVEDGEFISATATNLATGETSEFSNALAILNEIRVTSVANSGAGSLRQAILDANALPGRDAIVFAIGGEGPQLILPSSGLPALTESVLIDGYTQSDARPNSASSASNTLLRIGLDGSAAGNSVGLRLGAPDSVIRGLAIYDFRFQGIDVLAAASNALIAGNYIGLQVDGVTPGGNLGNGIQTAGTTVIGGELPPQRNVVGANATNGIQLDNTARVLGNIVGRSADLLQPRGNGLHGIRQNSGSCVSAFSGRIGGSERDAGNVVADNGSDGIAVLGGSCLISGNAIYGNGGLGIDLGDDGVTANDANDGDSGPNGLQNHPQINALTLEVASTTIAGQMLRPALPTGPMRFWLEFHAVLSCDPTGHGEGDVFLHAGQYDIGDDGLFSVQLPFAMPGGVAAVVATASSIPAFTPTGTSEFSACFTIERPDELLLDGFEG